MFGLSAPFWALLIGDLVYILYETASRKKPRRSRRRRSKDSRRESPDRSRETRATPPPPGRFHGPGLQSRPAAFSPGRHLSGSLSGNVELRGASAFPRGFLSHDRQQAGLYQAGDYPSNVSVRDPHLRRQGGRRELVGPDPARDGPHPSCRCGRRPSTSEEFVQVLVVGVETVGKFVPLVGVFDHAAVAAEDDQPFLFRAWFRALLELICAMNTVSRNRFPR